MFDIKKIKLIIWDLDETLWSGTLSEGSVELSTEVRDILIKSLDRGIIHSICSKNDYKQTKNKLDELKIWDYFVFPSIDWTAKGVRVKSIIETMALRDENVLFIDDNASNLNEALFVCPKLMKAMPDDFDDLFSGILSLPEKDKNHKRLKQYRVLEKKEQEKQGYISNDEFLMTCEVSASIHNDCENQIDRIVDLIQRSNQLNYTKNRMSNDEILRLLSDGTIQCGYVSAKDKFGDYGIIGFYAVKDGKAIQFAFSCRTLGMRIEQWTYMELGCPEIQIVGDVVADLNSHEMPAWVNNSTSKSSDSGKWSLNGKILFKGPCDMEQIFSFINKTERVSAEFTYVGTKGQSVEGYNHTAQLYSALTLSSDTKSKLFSKYPWIDKRSLDTLMSTGDVSCVILSMLTDGNLGVYRHKETGAYIALCEKSYDLTNSDNWNSYIQKSIFTSGINFSEQLLREFANDFEYVDNSDAELTMVCLNQIYDQVGYGLEKFILLLGSERTVEFATKKPSYENREKFHALLNSKIREWAKGKRNVVLLPFDRYVSSDSDYIDTINHFVKKVYFDLAKDIVENIAYISGKGADALRREEIKQRIIRSGVYKKVVYPVGRMIKRVISKLK